MPRRVFFSFHYEADIWRVSQIRNCRVTRGWEANSFLDAASWEAVRRRGEKAVTDWIDRQLSGTGVTVVLIGSETWKRRYVRYEIEQSYKRGNGLLGIYIHKMKDQNGDMSRKGRNPLREVTVKVENSFFGFSLGKECKRLSDLFPTYDWVNDDGYNHVGDWIEIAANKAGR